MYLFLVVEIYSFIYSVQTGLNKHSEAMIKAVQLRDDVKEQMTQMQEHLAAVSTRLSPQYMNRRIWDLS